jgi:hypothetical protein
MKQDRFLMGILIFIGVLVTVALAVFFIRKDAQQVYGPEDTPEGVIRNYALALQNQDYERAYGYLADKSGRPTYENFRRSFITAQLDVSSNAVQVGSVQFINSNEASVNVSVLFAGSGPFNQGWSSTENASLIRQADGWKLTYMPYPYWMYEWYQPFISTAVPVKP